MARTVRLTAHRAAERGIPLHLPAEEVESIPFFGRTWYVRGTGYWLRRVLAFVLLSVPVALGVVIEVTLLRLGSGFATETGRWVWRAAWGVQIVLSMVRPARALIALVRARRVGLPFAPEPPPAPSARSTLGWVARLGVAFSGFALVINIVLYFGWLVALLVLTLEPEYGVERAARLGLQRRHRDTRSPG